MVLRREEHRLRAEVVAQVIVTRHGGIEQRRAAADASASQVA